MPTEDQQPSRADLRERQDHLVRPLAVEQDSSRLQSLSDELEAIQRQPERARNS